VRGRQLEGPQTPVLGLQLAGLQVMGLQATGLAGEQRGVHVACAARALTVTVVTMAGTTQLACLSSLRRAIDSPGSGPSRPRAPDVAATGAAEESNPGPGGSLAWGMDASIHCGPRIC
jgi:hypothetical protein